MIIAELVEFVLIMAATAFLSGHATLAAFLIRCFIEFYTCFLAHAIMDLHGNPRRDRHVHDRYDGKQELFHTAKIENLTEDKI